MLVLEAIFTVQERALSPIMLIDRLVMRLIAFPRDTCTFLVITRLVPSKFGRCLLLAFVFRQNAAHRQINIVSQAQLY